MFSAITGGNTGIFGIDAGRRGRILNPTRWVLIPSEYPEIRNRILVRTMDEEEILAEKVETLLNRGKGRDLYDVWFLLNILSMKGFK